MVITKTSQKLWRLCPATETIILNAADGIVIAGVLRTIQTGGGDIAHVFVQTELATAASNFTVGVGHRRATTGCLLAQFLALLQLALNGNDRDAASYD